MTNFEMTKEQADKILNACKPVCLIALNCGNTASTRVNANRAWECLGKEMGFDWMTVKPNGQGDRFFSAMATTKASI